MTDTVVSSATREVVIGFERPVRDDRREDQPDRPQAARRGDEERRLQPRRGRRARPGRRRRTHARRQRRHPAGRRAGACWRRAITLVQSITDVPLSIDSSIIAALEAGLAVYQGKPLVNSVTGEDEVLGASDAARRQVRRRGRRDLQRRDRHLDGSRRALRGRQADRRARRRLRHPRRPT